MNATILQFGDFELDVGSYELSRHGRPIKLERIPMELLLLLLDRRGQLVKRDEILQKLWGKDVFLDADSSINTAISKIRVALKDDRENPAFIKTISGKGYRFIASVTVLPDEKDASTQSGEQRHSSDSLREKTLGHVGQINPERMDGSGRTLSRVATPSAQTVPRRWMSTTRNAAVAGLIVCGLALSFLFYRHSIRPKAVQTTVTPVVTNIGEKYTPTLSSDGQHLAFVWNGGAGPHFSLYVKVVGTEESLRLTRQASLDFNPVWSPDGRYIAFCRILKGATGIYIVPASGGAERKVRNTLWDEQEFYESYYFEGRLSWSPDGKLLAYSDHASRNEPASIFLLSLDSLEVRRLTSPPGSKGDYDPEFSPDGQTVAFARESEGVESIYAISVSGGKERRLTAGTTYKWGLAWTHDGHEIIFAD
jgi:DNA-binding winged helix-turn-helix (wHTH) protein